MDSIEKRALYNLLRMNWLKEPAIKVEPWQVEDYSALTIPILCKKLEAFDIHLDRTCFVIYADECDSPEELTDQLIADRSLLPAEEDQIYLLLFELWHQLMREKPSLSILCHELDEQIRLYDSGTIENPLALQETLHRFSRILEENVDHGVSPTEVFKYCAHDVETFLYNFISDQIDEENESYAHELLGYFDPFLEHNRWFKLLHIRLCKHGQSKTAQKIVTEILEEGDETAVDYYMELLAILAENAYEELFHQTVTHVVPLLTDEESFQDLLEIIVDFFDIQKNELSKAYYSSLLKKRTSFPLSQPLKKNDPDLIACAKAFA